MTLSARPATPAATLLITGREVRTSGGGGGGQCADERRGPEADSQEDCWDVLDLCDIDNERNARYLL